MEMGGRGGGWVGWVGGGGDGAKNPPLVCTGPDTQTDESTHTHTQDPKTPKTPNGPKPQNDNALSERGFMSTYTHTHI